MKVTVTIDGTAHPAKVPYPHAAHVVIECACPACGHKGPINVQGRGNRIESHDTYAAEAVAGCCDAVIGTIRAKVSTIFGIEEDERVLHGRARVY